LATENLTKEEIKNNLLLATDSEEETVWHMAVDEDNEEVIKNYGSWLQIISQKRR
jgi:hypothetical protein